MTGRLLLLVLLASAPLQAERFVVSEGGQSAQHAEVCVARLDEAAPYGRWFGTYVCHDADAEVPLEPGHWSAFARRGTEAVSETVNVLTTGTGNVHELHLVSGVRIDASAWTLAEGETIFAYVPRTASAIPLRGVVPASTRVIPVIVAHGIPVRVGVPFTADEPLTLPVPERREGTVDVVAPISFRGVPSGRYDLPLVRAGEIEPIEPLRTARHELLFFRGVPDTTAQLTLSGKRWRSVTMAITARGKRTVAVPEPLVATPVSKLVVHWWTMADLERLAQKAPPCTVEEQPQESKPFTVALARCQDPHRCIDELERELPRATRRGEIELVDVEAGKYWLFFRHPGLVPVTKEIEVFADELTEVDAELRWFTFHGRITRGGKPVRAMFFEDVVSDEDGRYTAVLRRAPTITPVDIESCDGLWTYKWVPDAVPVENTAYDIEVPDNRVVVTVVDAISSRPVANASVSFAAMEEQGPTDSAHFAGFGGESDQNGRYVFEPVLTKKRLRFCAARKGYESACADELVTGAAREKRIEIRLGKSVRREGRIVTAGAIEAGRVIWYSQSGQPLESAEVSSDGSFTYHGAHTPGEIVGVASLSHPFHAFAHPLLRADELFEIRFPPARVRTFQVQLSAQSREKGAFVTIALGDLVLPPDVLGPHLDLRGLELFLKPGGTITLPDVVESAPIRVVLLPVSYLEQHPRDSVSAAAMKIEARALPRRELGEATLVRFD